MQWFWFAKSALTVDEVDDAWTAVLECLRLQKDNPQPKILLAFVATTEPLLDSRLNVAWKQIFELQEEGINNGFLAGMLYEIAFCLKDPEKVLTVTENLEPMTQNGEDLIKKLPYILRELNSSQMQVLRPIVIEKLSQFAPIQGDPGRSKNRHMRLRDLFA